MSSQQHKQKAPSSSTLLGDLQGLGRQIGSPDLLLQDSAALFSSGSAIHSVEALKVFLQRFKEEVLTRVDLPVICRAHKHASANEGMELIQFDQEFTRNGALGQFAASSKEAGERQLKRLLPLKDHKVIQKYIRAHEDGTAEAWHSIVYGLTMAVYSIPLRQALMNYAETTIATIAEGVMFSRQLPIVDCKNTVTDVLHGIPQIVESVLKDAGHSTIH